MKTILSPESYGAFSRRAHLASVRDRFPVTASIEVTARCNCRCLHCYVNLPAGDATARAGELSLTEHVRLLDELAEAGTLWLLYTGGEPLLRPDFLDIYQEAKRRGFLITLFTNGTLIDVRVADTLAEWRPFLVEITLYGATAPTYDAITRVPGAFARCLRGIDLLLDRGVPLRLKSVVLRENLHELEHMQRLATERGLDFRFDAELNPRLDGAKTPLGHRIAPVDLVRLDAENERRMEEWGDFCGRTGVGAAPEMRAATVYDCGAALTTLAVDPAGRISPCGMARMQGYDFRRGTVADAWGAFLKSERERPTTRETRCTYCGLRNVCGMCPAYGWLENGDPEAPVDFLCHVAHLRAALLGLEVPAHGDCPYCPGGVRRHQLEREIVQLKSPSTGADRALHPLDGTGAATAED